MGLAAAAAPVTVSQVQAQLPGEPAYTTVMSTLARLADQGCRMIYVRHEHCAVAAAMAYARKQGDVGVATVTCGPGVTQLITALPAAVRARLGRFAGGGAPWRHFPGTPDADA